MTDEPKVKVDDLSADEHADSVVGGAGCKGGPKGGHMKPTKHEPKGGKPKGGGHKPTPKPGGHKPGKHKG